VWCSVLQCITVGEVIRYHNLEQIVYTSYECRTLCCSVLQCVAVYCSVLQCGAVRCSVLQFVMSSDIVI